MEDFTTSMPALNSGMNNGNRVTSSARFRRSNPGSPRKSVSIDSLHQQQNSNAPNVYYNDYNMAAAEQMSQQQSRQSSAGTSHYPIVHHGQQMYQHKPEYTLDTYVPATSTVIQNGGYYGEPVRSNPGSPSKRVAFKGLQNAYNHPVAQYNSFDVSNPARLDTPMMINQDDMLAIEADASRVSYPALMNGINNVTSSAMTPYSTANNRMVPVTSASKALVSPNNHVMTNSHPQLDYTNQSMVPMTYDKYSQPLINNPAYANIENAMKKNSQALPAIMAPNTGAVQPYINNPAMQGGNENEERKLELEYNDSNKAIEETNDKNKEQPAATQPKTSTAATTNNGVIKVAMVADISMSNFHQCK